LGRASFNIVFGCGSSSALALFIFFGCGGPIIVPDQPFRAIDQVSDGKALISFHHPPEMQAEDLLYPVYRLQGQGQPLLITVLFN